MVRKKTQFFSSCARHLPLYFSLFLISSAIICPPLVSAQTEEEMKMLRMYFREDELVLAPTRTPKLLSQAAENISIVTADDIKAMNAHTVTEVLSRVTGVFVQFFGEDFGSDALIKIQGSNETHVLVLLDGVPWNVMNGGNAITQTIPVGIIKQIEVIKGPASSAWGSSLGGVINIVTKDPLASTIPSGSVSASYGERSTQDYRTEVTGALGKAGYYLYAGTQESGGLRNNRDYDNNSFYSKFDIPFSSDVNMRFTAGYSEPHIDYGDLPNSGISGIINRENITRVFFATASLTADLTRELMLSGSLYFLKSKFVKNDLELSTGDLFLDTVADEETIGGSGKIIWKDNMHNAVLGVDVSDGSLDLNLNAGPSLQAWSAPATSESNSGIKKWAVFLNDTITIGALSVTPGIRYDNNNVDGDFTSPSLGATYKFSKRTIVRASVAKGFTTPPLNLTSGGGLFLDPNPDLQPEKVWSYQAGVESWIADFLHAKTSVFHHDMKDALVKELYAAGPPTYNDLFFNKGEIKRTGVELNANTIPFYNVSLKTGFTFVRIRLINEELYANDDIDTAQKNYAYNVTVKYDDTKSFIAQLDGRYVWWDLESTNMAKYDTFIWDINFNKKIYSSDKINSEIFLTGHNIFNSSLYINGDRKNPGRWLETGLRLSF